MWKKIGLYIWVVIILELLGYVTFFFVAETITNNSQGLLGGFAELLITILVFFVFLHILPFGAVLLYLFNYVEKKRREIQIGAFLGSYLLTIFPFYGQGQYLSDLFKSQSEGLKMFTNDSLALIALSMFTYNGIALIWACLTSFSLTNLVQRYNSKWLIYSLLLLGVMGMYLFVLSPERIYKVSGAYVSQIVDYSGSIYVDESPNYTLKIDKNEIEVIEDLTLVFKYENSYEISSIAGSLNTISFPVQINGEKKVQVKQMNRRTFPLVYRLTTKHCLELGREEGDTVEINITLNLYEHNPKKKVKTLIITEPYTYIEKLKAACNQLNY